MNLSTSRSRRGVHAGSLLICAGLAFSAQSASVTLPVVGKLPTQLQMHGSAVVGDRLYVIGGDRQKWGWSDDVHSAEISPAGKLSSWRTEAELPERRAYLGNGVEVVNRCIYLVNGCIAPAHDTPEEKLQRGKHLLWTRVDEAGRITQWKKAPLPVGDISFGATCSNDKYLVLTGGTFEDDYTDRVFLSKLETNGEPQAWQQAAVLPGKRWFHSAALIGDRLFVWGGLQNHDRARTEPAVYSAQLLEDGTISPWRSEGTMSQPVFSSGGCGLDDLLVSVGGCYANSYPTNAIWMCRLQDGIARNWTVLQTDLRSRVHHSLAMDKQRGWVYLSGGRNSTTPEPGAGERLDVVQGFRLK